MNKNMELFILQKIESLRLKMVNEAKFQGNLTNGKVVKLSQQLDLYIVFYQKWRQTLRGAFPHRTQNIHLALPKS